MDSGYELYCLTDPEFYDSATAKARDEPFAITRRELPAGWRTSPSDDWLMFAPDGVRLPSQGWKIHASARLHNAEQIVETIWDYCVSQRIAFKFIRSRELLFLRNMKYAHRGYSGKFATIFPADEAQFERILTELGAALDGYESAYILSDLRWGEGPLYVRYGGFAERFCVQANGAIVAAIEDADGELVPDRRGATFALPPGVQLPACLGPHLEARNSATMDDLPYRVERALHFSNGGGVYAGVDERSGAAIVLKEARPHAGLDRDERDAVARLQRERATLEQLAGLGVVPALLDYLVAGGHDFLVTEFVAGRPLSERVVDRYPLICPEPTATQLDEYAAWARALCERLEAAVAAVHARGIVLGDLHPSNVLVEDDGRIVLIDLELASHVDEGLRPPLADPGFAAPAGVAGFAIDHYALACLRLFVFLPLTRLLARDAGMARRLAGEVAELFPTAGGAFLDQAVHVIEGAFPATSVVRVDAAAPPALEPDPLGWVLARESMAQAILASATPERDDRLFPGDPKQFETGALSLAYGAAGVLYALAVTGAGRYPEHEAWLLARARAPESGTTRLGFYDGLHGVAYALDALDRRDDALALLHLCAGELDDGRLGRMGLDLYSGLAGIGLTLVHFAARTDDERLWRRAVRVAEAVADRLGGDEDVAKISGGEHPHAGLVRGSSGPALLFLRLFERFENPVLLDLAATALRQDLRRCIVRDDGALDVDEGWRTMPYLADGSAGIGLVLDEYLRHREDERFATAADAIRRTTQCAFYIEPGLFWGRAGMIACRSRAHAPGTAAARDPVVAAHVRRLGWHAQSYRGNLAFPGEELLRLSMDLATGTAGVLLALGAALHDAPVGLPFLAPAATPGDSVSELLLATSEGR